MGGVIDWLVKMWEAVRMLANEVGVASANPTNLLYVSERDGAVVKLTDSYPCGWGSIPGKSCSFLGHFRQELHCVCSDQHIKYRCIQKAFYCWTTMLNSAYIILEGNNSVQTVWADNYEHQQPLIQF